MISNNLDECIICLEPITADKLYCMIDNCDSGQKYHVTCLEDWLKVSTNGIMTHNKITSYSIYNPDKSSRTINIIDRGIQQDDCSCFEICSGALGCCLIMSEVIFTLLLISGAIPI